MISVSLVSQATNNILVIPLFTDTRVVLNRRLKKIVSQNKKFFEESQLNETVLESERIIFLGMGKKKELTQEKVRVFGAKLYHYLKRKELAVANVVAFSKNSELVKGFVEGLLLASYSFDRYKSEKKSPVSKVHYISNETRLKKVVREATLVCNNVCVTRDLINEVPSVAHPKYMSAYAKKLFKGSGVRVKVLGKKEMQKKKMGCALGVSRGASVEPQIIILEYNGLKRSKKKHVLVGKGITYDSGGLNLKPTGYLETMKDDMSGAAIVMGTIKALSDLKVKKNVVGILGCVENLIGTNSYKPGDVLISASGKTVEVANTDAEGRLVLADCLYLGSLMKPESMIDLATLTGAAVVAMGKRHACVMGNDQALVDRLIASGERVYERMWQLPLFDDFKEDIKSKIADIRNLGRPKGEAGTIAAGIFLQEFVGNTTWAHLDVAGPVWSDSWRNYIPAGGTGFGVRMLVDHFKNLK